MPTAQLIEALGAKFDPSFYEGAEYAFAAWRKDDRLSLLAGRVVAVPSLGSSLLTGGSTTDKLVVERGRIPANRLHQLFADLPTGTVRLGEHLVNVSGIGSDNDWWRNAYVEGARKTIGWPGEEFLLNGIEQTAVVGPQHFDALESSLLALTNGRFATLGAAGRFLGGEGAPLLIGRQVRCSLEVYAPIYLALRDVDFNHRTLELRFGVECRFSRLPDDFGVFVAATGAEKPVAIETAGWDPVVEPVRPFRAQVPARVGEGEIHLTAFGRTVESERFGVPSLAWRAHVAIDPDLGWLNGLLGATGKPTGDAFKHYVCTVLQLGGVPAVAYDFKRAALTGVVDLVAELGSGSLLIGECKSSSPTPDEVATLSARATEIVAPLGGIWRLETFKVMFTSVSSEAVPGETMRAGRDHDVHVVSRERLLEWQDGIAHGRTLRPALRALLGILDLPGSNI